MNNKLKSLFSAIGIVCVFCMSIAFIGVMVTILANTIIVTGRKLESFPTNITYVQKGSFYILVWGSIAFCVCAVFLDYFENKSDRQPDRQSSLTSKAKSKTFYPPCQKCKNFHGQVHGGNMLVCAIHPYGWQDENCPDFNNH